MQMKTQDCQQDWSLHYYEINDINKREALLIERIQKYNIPDDTERLLLLQKHFDGKQGEERHDRFMRAWMMIKILDTERITFLNRKRIEKELRKNLEELCVLNFERSPMLHEEWTAFACDYIHTYENSASYRQILWGAGKLSDKTVAMRIANDIEQITRILPEKFSLQKETEELHDIMKRSFLDYVNNGEAIYQECLRSIN